MDRATRMSRKPEPMFTLAEFPRPDIACPPLQFFEPPELSSENAIPWQSNGGSERGLPERSLPFTLDIPVPDGFGPLRQIQFIGLFARFAKPSVEAVGTLGASIQFMEGREIGHHLELINGRHYHDSEDLTPRKIDLGDGTHLETIGQWSSHGKTFRIDNLTIHVDPDIDADCVRFKDLGSPASFALFDVIFAFDPPSRCPFHSQGGGVTLGDLPAIVRVGDRVRLQSALDQLENSLIIASDLDEARGLALTFLAMVTAATLELGGSRSMHRVQLDAAREFDQLTSISDIYEATRRRVQEVAEFLTNDLETTTERLVNRALEVVDRHFGMDLSDASLAEQLGLSTSHFRFLFKQTTGQPFHKYLIAVRLEKARQMLSDNELPISVVAKTVGFSGLSHFSRAFTHRFNVTPTDIRKGSPV